MCSFPAYLYLLIWIPRFYSRFCLVLQWKLRMWDSFPRKAFFFTSWLSLLVWRTYLTMNCTIKADFTITLLFCCYNREASMEITEGSYMSTEVTMQALLMTSWQEGVNPNFWGQYGEGGFKKKDTEEWMTSNIKIPQKRERCARRKKQEAEEIKKGFQVITLEI